MRMHLLPMVLISVGMTVLMAVSHGTCAGCVEYHRCLPVIGDVDMPGDLSYGDVAVAGGFAFAAGTSGLAIVDISDRRNPQIVGSLQTLRETRGVAVSGSYAYLATAVEQYAWGLLVVDVSNPGAPRVVGSVVTPGTAYSVALSSNRAYLAAGDGGLQVINIADPLHPRVIGGVDTGWAYDVAIYGTFAYVTNGNGLQVVDLSGTRVPIRRGWVETGTMAVAVDVRGNVAYVGDQITGVKTIDVTNPDSPRVLGGLDFGWTFGIALKGRYLYATAGILRVIDVSDPSSPRIVGATYASAAGGVAIDDGYAYAIGSRLQVIDVRYPVCSEIVARAGTGQLANKIAVPGRMGYIAESDPWGTSGLLEAVDLGDPRHPRIVASLGTSAGQTDVAVAGVYAYVTIHASAPPLLGSVMIVDISDPHELVLVGAASLPREALGVVVVGPYAYVANGAGGLTIIDVTNPQTPLIMVSLRLPGVATAVAIVGNRAYVGTAGHPNGDGPGSLQIVDVTDPWNPTILGGLALPGVRGVAASGNFAYVAAGGLHVVDVSNPMSPFLVQTVPTQGEANDVEVAGSSVYLADGRLGLQVIDVTDPTRPALLGNIPTPCAKGVTLLGDYAFVADCSTLENEEPGLQVMPTQCDHPGADGDGVMSVERPGAPGPIVSVVPNPTTLAGLSTTIHFDTALDGAAHVAIHDLAGRVVRTLHDGSLERGAHRVVWDGREDSGREVPNGLYVVEVRTSDGKRSARIVVLR